MSGKSFGIESFTEEDRAYSGSRFSVVRDALFANPYQPVWGAPGNPPLPIYPVTLRSVLRGILPFGRPWVFRRATARVIDSSSDLRWGPEGKGFRLLHPNGIGLVGRWNISEKTAYSGYFRKGSQALVIARYSTCCRETRRGAGARSLSMVGKLFPTLEPDHADPLRTANFMTQQDIGGDVTDYINDAELRNAPDTTAWRRGRGISVLVITGLVFKLVDREPSIRQLYQIAELGKPVGEPTRAPTFMRLLVAKDQPRVWDEGIDFRDEIMGQIYDRGDPAPKRRLTFDIEVTDDGETHGLPVRERRTFRNWRRIGSLVFTEAAVSYNCDFVLHFSHPSWRTDQNDPATATRANQKKMRRPAASGAAAKATV